MSYINQKLLSLLNTTVTIENELGSGTNNIEMNYTFFKVLGER